MQVKTDPNVKAFTLIEMLVVVAIVMILAALLFPVTQQMIAASKRSACMSNLRGIGGALQLFVSEHDGKIMSRRMVSVNPTNGVEVTDWIWHRRLIDLGYVEANTPNKVDSSLFYCPSGRPSGPRDTRLVSNPQALQFRYGMRYWGVPGQPLRDDRLLPMAVITNLSRFFLVVDSQTPTLNTNGTQAYYVAQGQANWRISTGWHKGTANALFADGHVEAKNAEYFQNLHLEQGAYGGNQSNQAFVVWPGP